jgi:large subunit ribosomal protein L29
MATATKFETMKEWTAEERAAKAKEWTQSLFTLRLSKASGQLENPMKIRQVRKDIARLKTAARQNEMAAAGAKPGAARSRRKK